MWWNIYKLFVYKSFLNDWILSQIKYNFNIALNYGVVILFTVNCSFINF